MAIFNFMLHSIEASYKLNIFCAILTTVQKVG